MRHLETQAASSVAGAKGLGEGGAIGAPAVILNAVNDALANGKLIALSADVVANVGAYSCFPTTCGASNAPSSSTRWSRL